MNAQFLRFLLVGGFNTVFGYAIIFSAMYWFGLSPVASNVLGYAIALIVSFLLNKFFTFRSSGNGKGELLRFLVVFVLAYGANLAALYAAVEVLGINAFAGQVLAGIFYTLTSYSLSKLYVFRAARGSRQPETARP